MLFGYLIGLAIISAVSAGLVSLAVRLFYQQKGVFLKAFVVSFLAFLATLLVQIFFDKVGPKNSFTEVLPAVAFFISCWLLNAQFVSRVDLDDSKYYGRALLVTTAQCVVLFVVGIAFSLGLIAVLSSMSAAR